MIIVTGGAGFIGSNLIGQLNARGIDDILVVDNMTDADKFRNIENFEIADFADKKVFVDKLDDTEYSFGTLEAVFHQGACSDTMETNGRYMMENNYTCSKQLLDYCRRRCAPFIYASSASVYGSGRVFSEAPQNEQALNIYAYSKLLFDRYVRRSLTDVDTQIVGLRYFNVYGPRELHKGRMASVAHHFHSQYGTDGHMRLFEGSGGYEDGEQRRDFVWVGDVVDVNLFFLDHPGVSGIFNVGTGRSQSFNDVATAVVNATSPMNKNTQQLVKDGVIRYIPFPDSLVDKYQSYTQADISALRSIGYDADFKTVEDGVRLYVAKQAEMPR